MNDLVVEKTKTQDVNDQLDETFELFSTHWSFPSIICSDTTNKSHIDCKKITSRKIQVDVKKIQQVGIEGMQEHMRITQLAPIIILFGKEFNKESINSPGSQEMRRLVYSHWVKRRNMSNKLHSIFYRHPIIANAISFSELWTGKASLRSTLVLKQDKSTQFEY